MPGTNTVGLKAYGAYIPRLRLSRKAIADANAWFNPAIKGLARGERAICNWDEDSLTMGVEAARDCLTPARLEAGAPPAVAAVTFASTTLPFSDRQNAGILATALNFGESVVTMDFTASQRAGTSGLLNALRGAAAGDTLFVAADKRRTQASGPQELQFGDAGAAFTVGSDGLIAEYLGGHQLSTDFIDHYRGGDSKYDYNWEERWIRDEGYFKIAPRAIAAALAETGLEGGAVDHFIMPALIRGVPQKVAALSGIDAGAVRDTLQAQLGEAGRPIRWSCWSIACRTPDRARRSWRSAGARAAMCCCSAPPTRSPRYRRARVLRAISPGAGKRPTTTAISASTTCWTRTAASGPSSTRRRP